MKNFTAQQRFLPYRRIAATAAVIVSATLVITGCSSNAGTAPTGKASSKLGTVVMINPDPGSAPWQAIANCFTSEAKKEGVVSKVVGSSGTAYNVPATLELLQQQTALHVSAIALNHSGGAATLAPAIKTARNDGIYIASMESGDALTDRNFDTGISVPVYAAMVAKRITGLPGTKNVGILSIDEEGTSKEFLDTLNADLKSDASVHFVQTVLDNGDPTKDADVVGGMLSAHPNINIIVTDNPGQVVGVSTAIKEKGLQGKTQVLGISLDAPTEAALNDGTAQAIAVQNLCDVGTFAVDNFAALAAGKAVKKDYPVGLEWATKDNYKTLDPKVWG